MAIFHSAHSKSLKASLGDGVFWSITAGFTEMIFTPFAIFLGASPFAAGLVTTIPPLLGDLSQLTTNYFVGLLESRKKLVLIATFFQGIFILLLSLPLWNQNLTLRLPIGYFFILIQLYWIAWMLQLPAWQSWIGDLVAEDYRGRFFALRNRIISLVVFACLIVGGLLLDYFSKQSKAGLGFLTLLGIGFVGRVGSFAFLSLQEKTPEPVKEKNAATFLFFLKEIHRNHFGRFVLLLSFFLFATNISSPYLVPFYLEELNLSYGVFTCLMGILMAVKFITLPFWGKWSDAWGHQKLFMAAIALCCLPPFFLLFSRSMTTLILVQILGGITTGGYELTAFNLLLQKTEPHARTRHTAYYQVLTGMGAVCGTLAGGLTFRLVAPSMEAYHFNFLISGVLRIGLVLTVIVWRMIPTRS